jgi:hypothetical protein
MNEIELHHLDENEAFGLIHDICEIINMDPFEIIVTYGNTMHVDDNNEILYI